MPNSVSVVRGLPLFLATQWQERVCRFKSPAIDAAAGGFNIAQKAFDQLNGGQIGQGVVDVVANKVAASVCGL